MSEAAVPLFRIKDKPTAALFSGSLWRQRTIMLLVCRLDWVRVAKIKSASRISKRQACGSWARECALFACSKYAV